MSGPKKGTWHIRHDPTPQRLRALEGFRQKLEEWLSRQSSFLERNLGRAAVEEAQAAIDCVGDCIRAAAPSSGFDAYGAARRRFNDLWQRARAIRNRQRRNREQQQRLADEQRRQAQKATERRERIARAFAQLCESFDRLAECDLGCLPEDRHVQVRAAVEQHQREADGALEKEDEVKLGSVREALNRLTSEVKKETQAAQVTRAADIWRHGLETLGYAVGDRRTEADGTIVLEASRFPSHSINVGLRLGSKEVELNVNGEHDTVECVKDLNGLQTVLAQQGLELTITDWGRGHTGGASVWQQAQQFLGGS